MSAIPLSSLLAEFCSRLACGLACVLASTASRSVNPSYLKTLTLVVLGLAVLGCLAGPSLAHGPGPWLVASGVCAFLGYVAYTLYSDGPGRWIAVVLCVLTAVALKAVACPEGIAPRRADLLVLAAAGTSAVLMGSMLAAMLLGHSYLISPTMSIEPLKQLALWVGSSTLARALIAATGLALFRWGVESKSQLPYGDNLWWCLLLGRWIVGLLGPAVIAVMVWQTAKIRSTQSATGILYVGVILAFFGELTGQLLSLRSGVAL